MRVGLQAVGLCRRLDNVGRAAGVGAMVLAFACGRVEFGDDQLPSSEVPPPDAGIEVEMGVIADRPDLGPPEDLGCVPVELPTTAPPAWPFELSETAYRSVFWDFANDSGCNLSRCHGGGESPLIPEAAMLSAQADRAIAELWPILQEAERLNEDAPTGRLWRHLSNHPNFEGPTYLPSVPTRLDALLQQVLDCRVSDFLRAPPDSGFECGESTDAGTTTTLEVGVDADAGGADGPSSGPVGSCYCPVPDAGRLMTSFCAS